MAVKLPKGITFDDQSESEDSDSQNDTSDMEAQKKSNTFPTSTSDSKQKVSENFGSGDAGLNHSSPSKSTRTLAKKQKPSKADLPPTYQAHDAASPNNYVDTDSDSTIKAASYDKHSTKSSLSSTASTPRAEGAKDFKLSLTVPQTSRKEESRRRSPYENLRIPHIDSTSEEPRVESTSEESRALLQRRGSTNSGKSPSSVGSSLSQSSTDQYKTPPASPFKKFNPL